MGRTFKKAIIARALDGELTHHVGDPPSGTKPGDTPNHRNGTGGQTVLTDTGRSALTCRAIVTAHSSRGWRRSMNGEVTAWQRRPLAPMDPVVFLDALRVKTRDEATVRSTAVYLAVAVFPDGTRDILGIWMEQTDARSAG